MKAGQVIALSGNTGYSFGPHLHLDMFEADTDDYIDPLPFFKKKVKDNTAPVPKALYFSSTGQGSSRRKPEASGVSAYPKTTYYCLGIGRFRYPCL